MKCPACNTNLQHYRYSKIILDICPDSCGTWFDSGELREYLDLLLKDSRNILEAHIELNKKVITVDAILESAKICPCYKGTLFSN